MLFGILLYYFTVGHALMDFALQGDAIASCKCRGSKHPAAAGVPWYYWLTVHAFLHGGMVSVVIYWVGSTQQLGYTQQTAVLYGLAETVIHWVIDYAKCAKLFGIHTDQFLHMACKVLWALLLAFNVFA